MRTSHILPSAAQKLTSRIVPDEEKLQVYIGIVRLLLEVSAT